MKLQDLASVRSGLVLSRKQAKESSESYRYPLINLRCIQQEGTIQLKRPIFMRKQKEPLKEEYTLAKRGYALSRHSSLYSSSD
ncbi:MAG: hypothetical protein ACLTSG_06370 [Lachnospiraceae bacterium]